MIAEVCRKLKKDCDAKPYTEKVGGLYQTYCCEKGFYRAIEAFTNSLKK